MVTCLMHPNHYSNIGVVVLSIAQCIPHTRNFAKVENHCTNVLATSGKWVVNILQSFDSIKAKHLLSSTPCTTYTSYFNQVHILKQDTN
jgi:hypothetical protein